jgi:hypothetical protein
MNVGSGIVGFDVMDVCHIDGYGQKNERLKQLLA